MCKNQVQAFKQARDTQPHICQVCGKYIPTPMARCFAHVSGKGMDKKNRNNPNNLVLVCGVECHRKLDRMASGIKHMIQEKLDQGVRVTVPILLQLRGKNL